MTYIVEFTSSARKQLKKLDKPIQRRVLTKIKYFSSANYISAYAEQLKDFKIPTFRFRVGNYRIIFTIENEVATVVKIGHRRDIYKG